MLSLETSPVRAEFSNGEDIGGIMALEFEATRIVIVDIRSQFIW
jgi:hypothetical protein